MPYDSMSAWGKHTFQFNDDIQGRGQVWAGSIPFDSTVARAISRDDYTPPSPAASSEEAPSFNAAKATWSPPPSPRTRSIRYDSSPRSIGSSRKSSPRVDSPTSFDSPTLPLAPKTAKERNSLASKLYAASCAGDTKHIHLLLSLGAPINVPTLADGLFDAFKPAKAGFISALAGAAGNGQLNAVKLLLAEGAALNPTMKQSSSSPLHEACKADDPAMVAFLLDAGADVNILNCFNTTPLMYAGKYASPSVVRELLAYEPDLHRLSFISTAAIHWALWPGNAGNMELMLQAGADPDQKMGDGSTPLHCAALSDLPDVARLLLEFGADPTKRNEGWKTPLEVAKEREHHKTAAILEEGEREMREMLEEQRP